LTNTPTVSGLTLRTVVITFQFIMCTHDQWAQITRPCVSTLQKNPNVALCFQCALPVKSFETTILEHAPVSFAPKPHLLAYGNKPPGPGNDIKISRISYSRCHSYLGSAYACMCSRAGVDIGKSIIGLYPSFAIVRCSNLRTCAHQYFVTRERIVWVPFLALLIDPGLKVLISPRSIINFKRSAPGHLG
jgi:hypothetical protein